MEPSHNQTVPEQHTGKAQNQELQKTVILGKCIHTAESEVWVQNIYNWK